MVDIEQELADAEAAGEPASEPVDNVSPEKLSRGRPLGSKNKPKGTRVRASRASAATVSVPKRDHHAAEKREKGGTDADRQRSLAASFSGLWDAAAEMFDDDLLRVTDKEAQEWANPVQRSLKQYGQDHHIEKLAPLEAVGVTLKIAAPRVKRIVVHRAGTVRSNAPAPAFKGFENVRAEPDPELQPMNGQAMGQAFDPSIGERFDNPIKFDPRNLSDV